MEKGLTWFCIGILGCVILAAQSADAQTAPLPEFFGTYATYDGKLVPLTGGRGNFTPKQQNGDFFDFYSMNAATRPVLSLDGSDLRFVVFDAAVADASAGVELYKLPFARNLLTQPDSLQQVGGLLNQMSGRPQPKDAPVSMQKFVVAKTDALKVELLQKPVPGQPQMIQLVPESTLDPGIYSLFALRSQGGQQMIVSVLFDWNGQSAGAAKSYCVDLSITGGFGGAMDNSDARMLHPYYLAKEKYAECGASGSSASSQKVDSGQGDGNSGSAGISACSGYNDCFNAGTKTYGDQNSAEAIADFKAAIKVDPTQGQAWYWLGIVMLQAHQIDQVGQLASVWDKALSLGSPIAISACHERGFEPCERGNLNLSPKWVSFSLGDTQIFNLPPNQIEPGGILNNPSGAQVAYRLKASGKKYNIDFVPSTWSTCSFNQMVQCPQQGYAEQLILAEYVALTLPRLAQGFGAASSGTSAPVNPEKPPLSSNSP